MNGDTMQTKTIASTTVELNDEGFFTQPDQWNRAMVPELARAEGIEQLGDGHWRVIDFMRQEFLVHGTGPSVRALSRSAGVPIKELYQLFPRGPAKVAARIAGIPKPRGCI
jgi:tRNA 2-thiouridine synthesizing protein E